MIGAIIGDIAGSTYEFHSIKTKDFPLFAPGSNTTDDSLMSIAVASALMQTGEGHDGFKRHVVTSMRQIAAKYPCPMGGYGGRFRHWLVSPHPRPYAPFRQQHKPCQRAYRGCISEAEADRGYRSAAAKGISWRVRHPG